MTKPSVINRILGREPAKPDVPVIEYSLDYANKKSQVCLLARNPGGLSRKVVTMYTTGQMYRNVDNGTIIDGLETDGKGRVYMHEFDDDRH